MSGWLLTSIWWICMTENVIGLGHHLKPSVSRVAGAIVIMERKCMQLGI